MVKIQEDVNVNLQTSNTETCPRSGMSNHKTFRTNINTLILVKKRCKKALMNRKKLAKINSQKYFLGETAGCL